MSTEQEIRKTFNVFEDKDGIVHFEIVKSVGSTEDNVTQAELAKQDIEKIIAQKQSIKLITDLKGSVKDAGYPSPTAKKIYNDIIARPEVEKLAIIIPSLLFSSIVRFTLGQKVPAKVKIFSKVEPGLNWLKGIKEKPKPYHIEPKM